MANLGNYQVGDELFRPAFARVCRATPLNAGESSGGSNDFVIKIFDPASSGTEDPAHDGVDPQGAAAFVESFKTQKQVAESGKYWAPIHESGTSDGKPWYVTTYYARTAQKLLSGRVILNPIGLHEIIQSVVLGLVELKSVCGRAHGNLKPTNVLIGGQGRVAEGKFVLADPTPGPCIGNDAEAEDLLAVGGLLYQLVMHSSRPPTAGAAVAESEEWTRLGRRGRAWRQLCSDLLSFHPAERKTLGDLERTVRALVPMKIPVGKIAAAVAGFAAIIGTTSWGASRWEQSARAEVIAAQEQWFSVLQDPSLDDVFEVDPRLHERLIDDASHKDTIQGAVNAEGLKALNSADIRQVIRARLIYRDSRRRWIEAFKSVLGDLSDKVKLYKSRGWQIPDRYAQVPTVDDNLPARDIAEGARQLRELKTRLFNNDPNSRWAALEKNLDVLKSANDNSLAKFAEVLRSSAAGAIALSKENWEVKPALQRSEVLAAQLIDKKKGDFDLTRFRAEETNINLANPALSDIEKWLGRVDLYARAPDAAKKAADDCRAVLFSQIPLKLTTEEWPKSTSPEFAADKSRIDLACAALGSGSFLVKDVRLDEETRGGPLYVKRTEIKDLIAAFRLKYYVAPANPAEFVASLAPINLKDARLKSIWDGNINDLKGKKPGDLPLPQFESRKLQILSLGKVLKSLDDFASNPTAADLPAAYLAIAEARRQNDFKRQLDQVGDGFSLAAGNLDQLATEIAKASGVYAEWSNRVKDLARDFGVPPDKNVIIELTSFADQKWTSDAKLSMFWQKEVRTPGTPLNALLGPYLERLDKLRAVQEGDLNSAAALLTGKTDPQASAEVMIAVWRRLVSEGILAGPASIGRLKDEASVRVNLDAVKSRIDSKELVLARESQISGLLQSELDRGPSRWCAAVKSATSAAEVRIATGLAQQFRLLDDKSIAARTNDLGPSYYNVALALTQDAIASSNAALVPPRLDALARAADGLPAPVKSDFATLVVWLKSGQAGYGEPLRLQLAALLQDSLFYFPPGAPPKVLDQVFAAVGRLKDSKQPQLALALLKGFSSPAGGGLTEPLRTKFARQFYDLGNSLAQDPMQLDAFVQSMRLGNKDAIAAAMAIPTDTNGKTAMIKELKNLAEPGTGVGSVDALVQLAKINETGWSGASAVSMTEARRLYTLADLRQNAEAHKWLQTHPPEPVFANEGDAAATLSQYRVHSKATDWAAAAADLRKLNGLQSVSPLTKQAIASANAGFAAYQEGLATPILSDLNSAIDTKKWGIAEADIAKLTAMQDLPSQLKQEIANAQQRYKAAFVVQVPPNDDAVARGVISGVFEGHVKAHMWKPAAEDIRGLRAMRISPPMKQEIDSAEARLIKAKANWALTHASDQ